MSEKPLRLVPVICLTCVVVVGLYNAILLGPATEWMKTHAFADFGNALPSPTQFIVDLHWVLFVLLLLTHGGAIWASHRRFGVAACVAAILLSGLFTGFWVYSMHLPFFSLAAVIK